MNTSPSEVLNMQHYSLFKKSQVIIFLLNNYLNPDIIWKKVNLILNIISIDKDLEKLSSIKLQIDFPKHK